MHTKAPGLLANLVLNLILAVTLYSQAVLAADPIPECPAYNRPLPINNRQVLHWKRTTPNQFRERANVEGPVVHVYPDRNGHEHFVINIGGRREDVVELIYNQEFGDVPHVAIGMIAQACGDYITSTKQSGNYPPSPVGAIVHWLHKNPHERGHAPGFLVLDGVLYGQDLSNARPRPRFDHRNFGISQLHSISAISAISAAMAPVME